MCFLCTQLFVQAKTNIPANHKLIEYTGRIDFSDKLAPKFSFSGVSIRACFTGTSISVVFDDTGENYYNVVLNGEVVNVLHVTSGKRTYVLAENLADSTNEIELFKRTELTFGRTQFFGFVLDEGKSLIEIRNKRDKMIEFIGNSITCGYGNEGTSDDDFLATNENHYMTYAAITARNFNARHMAVSRSGIGVYRNYNGPREGNHDNMTNLYPRVFLYDPLPGYDFKEKPDLVCINLGTNDFSTTGADSALYVQNYLKLISFIQSKYVNVDVICLLGPMISGETLLQARSIIKHVAVLANSKNNGRVAFFEMSNQTGDLGIGVHYHPTVAQHQKNAEELTSFICKFKGWECDFSNKKENPSLKNGL